MRADKELARPNDSRIVRNMDYRNDITETLKNYRLIKKELTLMKALGKECKEKESEIAFIEYCMTLLEDYERELVARTFIDGVSVRSFARACGYSRNYVTKEREKILTQLNTFFKIKYESA